MLPLRTLIGALVIDSEGLVYGRVSGYRVEEGTLLIEATATVGGKPHPKGIFPADEVVGVDKVLCVGESGLEEVGVVLLSSPREARYRGLGATGPMLVPEEELAGRLVLDTNGRILGRAVALLLGPGGPGLRAGECFRKGWVNWIGFVKGLRERGFRAAAERVSEKLDPYSSPRVGVDGLSRVSGTLDEMVPGWRSIIRRFVEGEGSVVDIPWSSVIKVGDVVLVRAVEEGE